MLNAKSTKRKHDSPKNITNGGLVHASNNFFTSNNETQQEILPNKIFITEEKMANALKELTIGSSDDYDFVEDTQNDQHVDTFNNGIVFTDELKMNLTQNEDIFNIKKFFLSTGNSTSNKPNHLQIVPWTPSPLFFLSEKNETKEDNPISMQSLNSSMSAPSTKTFYKVEEPQQNTSDTKISPNKTLKRKHSHIRKIPIEDVSLDAKNYWSNTESSHYVVSNEDGDETKKLGDSLIRQDYKEIVITDISNECDENMVMT